jgi:putative Holliday junction resolvase
MSQTPEHPILAIDYGEARVGVAATDLLGIGAHPVETIQQKTSDPCERIAAIVAERGIRHILLGLPLHLDGSEGRSAAKVRHFGEELAKAVPGIPLEYVDERHTTSAAAAKLRQAGRSARRQKDVIDQAAALEILNDWLDETGGRPG